MKFYASGNVHKKEIKHATFLFLRIPNLIFEFDTAFGDSIQYLTQHINLFGNIMWKSVKLHFSVNTKIILGDLKVLRRSPDLLNHVIIGQGQLQLIMEQILFYHIWGLQPFLSSDLNNQMNNPSNSPLVSEKKMFR